MTIRPAQQPGMEGAPETVDLAYVAMAVTMAYQEILTAKLRLKMCCDFVGRQQGMKQGLSVPDACEVLH